MNFLKPFFYSLICISLILACAENKSESSETVSEKPAFAFVIHGGAGTILKENMTDELEKEYRDSLDRALSIGEAILKEGGSAETAVIEAIKFMENCPLFNAGKGSVFTNEGKNSMDASIMRGKDMQAGAVAGVSVVKNPITAAAEVMNYSPHVLLSGTGADQFAERQGLEITDPKYFYTQKRYDALQRARSKENSIGSLRSYDDFKFGTVGAVALDKNGDIAAGTSTGGMTNKKYGRIGDSPIIGSGTYANNATCGVSCTGHGEYFIRWSVAHDISALIQYKGMNAQEAGEEVINNKLLDVGGSGGAIILDKDGNIAMPFNTAGMYRGYVKPNEKELHIFR